MAVIKNTISEESESYPEDNNTASDFKTTEEQDENELSRMEADVLQSLSFDTKNKIKDEAMRRA